MDIETAHEILAKNCGIAIDDTVKVLRSFETDELGEKVSWNSSMLKYVGKTGKVISVTRSNHFEVRFDDGDVWFWPFFVLEKIESTVESTVVKAAIKVSLALSDVPRDVLLKVRDKWQKILDSGKWDSWDAWSGCAMCEYCGEYANTNDIDISGEHVKCMKICPLYKLDWCKNSPEGSKLHGTSDGKTTTEWLGNVAEFICVLNKTLAKTETTTKKADDDTIKVGDTVEILKASYFDHTEDIGKKIKVTQVDDTEPKICARFWYSTEAVRKVK